MWIVGIAFRLARPVWCVCVYTFRSHSSSSVFALHRFHRHCRWHRLHLCAASHSPYSLFTFSLSHENFVQYIIQTYVHVHTYSFVLDFVLYVEDESHFSTLKFRAHTLCDICDITDDVCIYYTIVCDCTPFHFALIYERYPESCLHSFLWRQTHKRTTTNKHKHAQIDRAVLCLNPSIVYSITWFRFLPFGILHFQFSRQVPYSP